MIAAGQATEVIATLVVSSPSHMQQAGMRLGQTMRRGDVVALVGPLGAGKTTMAQGIAAGLGVPPDRHVASPTFSLVNQHPGRVPFVHVDFYRVAARAELRELGLDEAFDEAAVAIEWADRYWDVLPADHLGLVLAVADGGARQIEIGVNGPRSRALAAALVADPG